MKILEILDIIVACVVLGCGAMLSLLTINYVPYNPYPVLWMLMVVIGLCSMGIGLTFLIHISKN